MISSYNVLERPLSCLKDGKMLICTLNAHSYNMSRRDWHFSESLRNAHLLIPDGVAIVWAKRILEGKKIKKIAGYDLFYYDMNRLQQNGGGKAFFLGSSECVLERIKNRAASEFPDVEVYYYSPPFKPEFSDNDTRKMIEAVNQVNPDVLFVGMTAPKQEKWVFANFDKLHTGHINCVGAVFDFYAGTVRRAPDWMIRLGLEWFYRLIRQPKRMFKRYIIGNGWFTFYMLQEFFSPYRGIPLHTKGYFQQIKRIPDKELYRKNKRTEKEYSIPVN